MKKGEKALFTIPPALAYGESGSPPTIPPNSTLQFEIELLSWTKVKDICKDVKLDGKLQDGSAFEKKGYDDVLFEFKIDEEKNPALLTTRAGVVDPFAIPSICRISYALPYPTWLEGPDSSLASVLESMEFCQKSSGSEACVSEELSNAINLVHTRRDLVNSGRSLLTHAYQSQKRI